LRRIVGLRSQILGALLGIVSVAVWADAARCQSARLRLLSVDMYGGPVVPERSKIGVSFGARVGFATLFTERLRLGVGLDWWTATRDHDPVQVRDVVARIDAWTEFGSVAWVRPYLGLSGGLHSVEASLSDGPPAPGIEPPPIVERLDGLRFGGAGFTGAAFQLTETAAIWLLVEYRYSLVSRVSNHELRGGARFVPSGG
jgi:hypothetical protein